MLWVGVKGQISHSNTNRTKERGKTVKCSASKIKAYFLQRAQRLRCSALGRLLVARMSVEVLTFLLFTPSETGMLCVDKWGLVSFLVALLGALACTLFGKLQNRLFASCQETPGGLFFFSPEKNVCFCWQALCLSTGSFRTRDAKSVFIYLLPLKGHQQAPHPSQVLHPLIGYDFTINPQIQWSVPPRTKITVDFISELCSQG